MVVSQLPTPERPLAEVETNVVFSTGTAGWDCGEWFWRDRRANAACRVEGSAQRLDMTLYLRDREAKSLASSVFPTVVSPTCFNPDWNLARVVSRGSETIRVESKISINALTLRVR